MKQNSYLKEEILKEKTSRHLKALEQDRMTKKIQRLDLQLSESQNEV